MDNRTSIIKDPILSGKIDGKFNLRETSPRIPGKTSNFQGQGTTVFRKPNFRSAKVIRQLSPYSKFKEIKYLFESPVIQDDYAPNLENLAPKPGLDGINRHKGCISAHTNTSAHAEISGIYFQREPVHVQCTTLRTNYSPLYLHPSNELPNISAAKKGSVCPSILGRSDTLGRITRRTKEVGTTNSANFGKAGVHSELREVPINPLSRLSVARDKMDPELVSDGINSAVSGTSKRIGKSCSSDEAGIATTNRIVTGSNSICMPNTTTGKTACPQTTKDIEHSDWNTKRRANPAATRLDKCSPMVDKPCELENQSLHQKPFTQRSSIYRCIKCRVWSPYRLRFLYSRTMVKGRYAVAHKFQRTLGFSSSCGIRYHPRKRYNCSVYRQYCSLLLHKKSRLESFSCATKSHRKTFSDSRGKGITPCTFASRRFTKRYCRCPFPRHSITNRMVTEPRDLPRPVVSDRLCARSGCYGNAMECSATTVHMPLPASTGIRKRLFPDKIGVLEKHVHLSTTENSFEGFGEDEQLSGSSNSNRPQHSSSAVVPNSQTESLQNVETTSSPTTGSSGHHPSTLYSKLLSLSRMDFMKCHYEQLHGSAVASRMIKAFRKSTMEQYERTWRAFQSFLIRKNCPIICKSIVLEFLEDIYNVKQVSPRTVLGYRNSLSLPLGQAFGIDFSSKDFSLLARAQFLDKPTGRKIMPQWSLTPILKRLSSDEYNVSSCSLDKLLQKTLFLVSLATGNRGSEIAAIKRNTVSWRKNCSEVVLPVKLGFVFKNQRYNKAPPNISFTRLSETEKEHSLCPIYSLKQYIERTKDIAKDGALFVNPYNGKNLQRPSISLWICRLIEEVCPGSVPKGHDMRKQATSLAWVRGIAPDEIIKSAFWTSSNVFIKHYLNTEITDDIPCVALNSR